ncbi:unnamed protein product, partial [Symbiodinium sp. CCMP2456]
MAGSGTAKEVVTKVLENGQVWVDLGLQTPVRPAAAECKSFDRHQGCPQARALPPLPKACVGPGRELRAAAAAEEPRPCAESPGRELRRLREDLARFTSEGSAKLGALDADLRDFLGEQQ